MGPGSPPGLFPLAIEGQLPFSEPHNPRILQHLVTGTFSLPGVAGVIVGHPFDTVKVSVLW